jgi:hypothetical protein
MCEVQNKINGGDFKMALQLSDLDLLRQSVESVEPRELFLKVYNKKDYDKRREVLKVLRVDVKNIQPIYIHQHFKYKRKEYKENWFMYVDENYKIIGFTKGAEWDSSWMKAEDYDKLSRGYNSRNTVIKTRKKMWERSFHILMFKAEDIKDFQIGISSHYDLRGKNTHEIERRKSCSQLKQTLSERIFVYRDNKYKDISNDDLISMIGKMLVVVSQDIVDGGKTYNNIIGKLNHLSSRFVSKNEDLILHLVDSLRRLKDLYSDIDSRLYSPQHTKRNYTIHKIKIIDLYRDFFGKVF